MSSCDFDVIVVGGGHAGVEACLASARLGVRTLLVTTSKDRIAFMSCNPSVGGLAKGHMVREIDVLGGEMGFAADQTCIQYKRLNSSKGPAVRGTRVQSDKIKYARHIQSVLQTQENLTVLEGEVKSLLLEKGFCGGVAFVDGSILRSKAVVITTGTFMNGVMHVGLKTESGGRVGEAATIGLSDQLAENGFTVRRLKTGTPARLYRESIDWSKTEPQYGDEGFFPFSFRSSRQFALPQVACHLSRTTPETHEIIRSNLHLSPMYGGLIEGVGPRYCPSIEDKIVRFADRDSHQTFLEPESLESDLIYLQGISTSLPEDVQMRFLRTISGLENVRVARFGYAVEYDFIEPTQIWHRLETRTIPRLFLAGQVNGTSGYEEAAVQGLIAGVNAAHSVLERPEFVLGRDEAYAGVLVDDLVTKGTNEPYRMFTSRAEHRLVLREDNTIDRLASLAASMGLVSGERLRALERIREERALLLKGLQETRLVPKAETQVRLEAIGSKALLKPTSFAEILRRPEIRWEHLSALGFEMTCDDPNVSESVEIEVKYAGYVQRQMELIGQTKKFEEARLPEDFDYTQLKGLSAEEVQKLTQIRPRTLGQAQRISGVNPSAIQAIMISLRGRSSRDQEKSVERDGSGHSVANRTVVS